MCPPCSHLLSHCCSIGGSGEGRSIAANTTCISESASAVQCALLCCVPGDKARGSLWLTSCTATDYGGSDTRFFTSCDSWNGQSGSPMWDNRGQDMYYVRAGKQTHLLCLLCTSAGLLPQHQPQGEPDSVDLLWGVGCRAVQRLADIGPRDVHLWHHSINALATCSMTWPGA